MIDVETLQQLATKLQTTGLNVAREYCQHLVLAALYQRRTADRVLFKGGTALRIVYGSPRFSEDLDFSGFGLGTAAIEDVLADALSAVERAGIDLDLEEAKTTSGGYLGIVHGRLHGYEVAIQLEVSLRTRRAVSAETALIAGELVPAYTLLHLPQAALVEEKLQALLSRGKPRDFYDLYFILRKGLLPPTARGALREVLKRLARADPSALRELRLFLPKNHQAVVKDFRATLERELRRHVA